MQIYALDKLLSKP